jgi:hypothetical protein
MTDRPKRPDQPAPRLQPAPPADARDAAVEEACRLLRARRISADVLGRIASDGRLQASHEVRLRTVLRPELPLAAGLPLLGSLRWRDLARVMDDVRLFAPLRARAEQLLGERIEEMTSGEKVTLARLASRVLIRRLRDTYDARVVAALLSNPRTIEEDALRIARSESSPSSVLGALSRSERWAERHAVRLALAQNPRCPSADALRAMRGLPARDLEKISENPSAPRLVRIGATRLLAETTDALH